MSALFWLQTVPKRFRLHQNKRFIKCLLSSKNQPREFFLWEEKLTCFITISTNKNKDKKVEENKQKIYLHENMESK